MKSKAILSRDRKFRYVLTRDWSEQSVKKTVMFIGLNPSIADEEIDDPTIRRCVNYAKSWGFNKLIMTNLFAYRATKPREMLRVNDPIGSENNQYLLDCEKNSDLIVACWGNLGVHMNRCEEVMKMIKKLTYLKLTKQLQPAHPLFLSKDLLPKSF